MDNNHMPKPEAVNVRDLLPQQPPFVMVDLTTTPPLVAIPYPKMAFLPTMVVSRLRDWWRISHKHALHAKAFTTSMC